MIEGLKTKVKETKRIYSFPGNWHVVLDNVEELIVRPSGTHRLRTKDGNLHIVPIGWIHIEIDSPDNWVI